MSAPAEKSCKVMIDDNFHYAERFSGWRYAEERSKEVATTAKAGAEK